MNRNINFIKNPLISGSFIIFFGSTFANFLNFIFNIFISRNLSVQDYGTVASLMVIVNLFGISASAITPTIVSFTSEGFLKNDLNHVKGVYLSVLKPLLFFSALILLGFIFLNSLISEFLNISDGKSLIILTGLIIFLGYVSVLNTSLLQSRLSFKTISFLNLFASSLKLIMGLSLILGGFKTLGAMVSILFSYIIPYILGFAFLKFLFGRKEEKVQIDIKQILKFALPSGLCLLGLTAIISTDLILVKHLFVEEAGIYAGLALVGKVIFFFTAPIGIVMFPLMTRRHTNKESGGKMVPLALILVALSSLGITIFYFIFPDFVMSLFLKNAAYLVASPLLGYYGLFISLYSLCSILMYYFISIKKTWIYIPIIAAALFQGIGIYLFHDSFSTIIYISILITFVLLVVFGAYYFYLERNK